MRCSTEVNFSQLESDHCPWLTTADNGTAVTSRKGTVRNTDSFFKDDGVETRKINLTPSLLRDDSNGSVLRSSETKDVSVSCRDNESITNVNFISSKPGQVSILSKKILLPKKARKIRSGKRKEACWVACSNERTRRAKVTTRNLKTARNQGASWQGRLCHPRRGCRRSQKIRWNH